MNGTNINNGLETSNTNNDAPNSLPEGITEEQSSSSGSVETFDILSSNQNNVQEETITESDFVNQSFEPQEIAPAQMNIQSNNQSIDTNNNGQVTEFNPNVTEIKDEKSIDPVLIQRLSMVYIGKNSEKFNKIPNFAAFFFTYLYAFYRKMYLLGIILIILEIIISLLLKNILFSLIINVIMLFGFNFLYILHVKRKVIRIHNSKKNKDKTIRDITDICAISGGTSSGMVFVSIMISIVLGLVIGLIFSILGIAKNTFGSNINSIDDVPKVVEDYIENIKEEYLDFSNNSFLGVATANYDEDLPKSFSVTIPYSFTNNTTTLHTYSYEYYKEGVEEPTCIFTLFQAKGYTSGDTLINKIIEYDKEHGFEISPKEEIAINNINFITIVSKDSKSDIYYYSTTKNNKAYLAEYIVNKENDDCLAFKDQVINSIKEVN